MRVGFCSMLCKFVCARARVCRDITQVTVTVGTITPHFLSPCCTHEHYSSKPPFFFCGPSQTWPVACPPPTHSHTGEQPFKRKTPDLKRHTFPLPSMLGAQQERFRGIGSPYTSARRDQVRMADGACHRLCIPYSTHLLF